MKKTLSFTKKYHNRKRVLNFFLKAYNKLRFWQNINNRILKGFSMPKKNYLKAKENLKELVCYQQKQYFVPNELNLQIII